MPERYTSRQQEGMKPLSRMAEGAGEVLKGAADAVGLAIHGALELFRSVIGMPSKKKNA